MITKQEIMTHARDLKLSPNTIEKDYVLNWILAGIAKQKNFSDNWIFKGGTCLKKCFFEEYRFSEDLDFTLLNANHVDESFLKIQFTEITNWIYDASGIELPESHIEFELYENPHGNPSIEGRIGYQGPMQRRGNLSRIKLDLTNDEKVVLKPELRNIYHPYSDKIDSMSITAYCLEEIFAEKLRALAERLRPRDLYDVIRLHQDQRWRPNCDNFLISLREKCLFKNIDIPTMEFIANKLEKAELIAEWKNMLGHQIDNLPSFEYCWAQLPHVFSWMEES